MSNSSRNRRAFIRTVALAPAVAVLVGVATLARADEHTSPPSKADVDPLAGISVLERRSAIRAVLERNRSLQAAREAWRAALAREHQETALEDPMLFYGMAPLSISGDARFGQEIRLSQQFPFPGKRRLRGEAALAGARGARGEWEEARLRLALLASNLFDALFVVHRALAINEQHHRLLESLKKSAEAQYVVGRASQQDALQAEVELSHILHDKVVLEAERERLHAQLNGLLHRPPRAALPPPPENLAPPTLPTASSEDLQEEALRRRPELAGLRARVGGADAAVRSAKRSYYPDLMVMGSYNSMWMETPHQFMAGVSINVPIFTGKRSAAVDEAQAQMARLRREEEQLVDDIQVQVDQAHSRVREAHHLLELYQARLLPAARDQVAAARAGFETGTNGFLAAIEAEKNLRSIELRFQTALAEVHRRHAELDRTIGNAPDISTEGGAP